MIKSSKQILRWILGLFIKLKTYFLNYTAYLKLVFTKNTFSETDNILLVTIKEFNHGRYGFQLINYFSKAGYKIVFYKSSGFLTGLFGYDRLIFDLPGLDVCLDKDKKQVKYKAWLRLNYQHSDNSIKIIDIDLNCFGETDSGNCVFKMPFYIHPLMNKYIETSAAKVVKKNRVLFYGQDNLSNDDNLLENYFQKISRKKVFKALQNSSIPFQSPENYSELLKMLDDDKHTDSLFIIDSNKIWVPNDQWLNLLSRFSFFVATPGVAMPVSHNVIEAMALGTIPILQYPETFTPALVNNENCLIFDSLPELEQRIKEALTMNSQSIDLMRMKTVQFFKENIEPTAFVNKMMNAPCSSIKLYFNAEEFSIKNLNLN